MYKYIIFLFVVLPACKQTEPQIIKDVNGIITSKPELWIASTSINKNEITIWDTPATFGNIVVVSAWDGERDGVKGLDYKTGEVLWEWYDDFENYNLSIKRHHIEDNYLIWQMGKELYCIDMVTGNTVFKKRYELDPYLRAITGNGNDIFIIAESHSPEVEGTPSNARLYKTSISEKGKLSEIAQPIHNGIKYDGLNNYSLAGAATVVTRNSKDLVLFNSIEPDEEVNKSKSYMHLFNLTDNQWVYQQALITNDTDSFLQKKPGVWGNFVYLVMNDWVICTDLMTGEVVWKKGFTVRTHFVTSGYHIAEKEGLLLVNAEANGTTLYALDLKTGQEVWQVPSSGTSTEMQYLNGVVYFVGGGDGWLHAVEVETGKHIWKLVSPYDSNGDYFIGYCAVVAAEGNKKGTVIAASGLNAFAYEAER